MASLTIFGLFLMLLALFFTTIPEEERTPWLTVCTVVCMIVGIIFVGHGIFGPSLDI